MANYVWSMLLLLVGAASLASGDWFTQAMGGVCVFGFGVLVWTERLWEVDGLLK